MKLTPTSNRVLRMMTSKTEDAPPSGLVIVDKPQGITSHDVVARVRRLAGTRKVGHAGTLDPMATGILVLGINRATRLLGHLMLTDKTYHATLRLGQTTTTDDAEGEILTSVDAGQIKPEEIRQGLAAMVGDIDQRPSSVSAIKVDGQRAYARVRAGEQVELPPRRVRINSIDVIDINGVEVEFKVSCSSGTYIRAIARDLGEALGVGGHLTSLRRTSVGSFDHGFTLEELSDDFTMVPIAQAARATFPTVELDESMSNDVRVGRKLTLDLGAPGEVALFDPEGTFLALYKQRDDQAVAVAVFV